MSSRSPSLFAHAVDRLRRRLARPLPGRGTMMDLAPSERQFISPEEARALGSREGGALVLVYPVGGVAHTVLTLRRGDLRVHAGQVSLPGGRVEAGESPRDAALREAWEELAIPPGGLDVLGPLTPIYIPPTHYLLHATVAARASRPDFRGQVDEVDEVIEAPIDLFLGETSRRVETWVLRGERRRVPFYAIGRHKVWGATAMILREFAAIWSEAQDEASGAGPSRAGGRRAAAAPNAG